jgi:small subunit ribosomal protein S6
MPVQLYETLFLLDSAKLAAEPDAVKGQLHTLLEKFGGHIEVSRPWDDRKLSYPIKKQKKGSYYIVYYRIDSLKQADIERDLKLNENLLRHMTLVVDPKWADTVLDVARNDHAAAFAIRGMQDETAPGDMSPTLGENVPEGEAVTAATGGRRPRREPVGEKSE